MPYLALFSRPPSSVSRPRDRLPLHAPEEIAPGWTLMWRQADGALVLPGEQLCVFHSPADGTKAALTAPVPGILQITASDCDWLVAGSRVGDLRYGAAVDAALKELEATRQSGWRTAAATAREQQEELARLRADAIRMEKERDALRRQLAALAAAPPTDAGVPDAETKMATTALESLAALLDRPAILRDCDAVVRLHGLLLWEKRLHEALQEHGAIPAPLPRSRTVLTIRAQGAVADLYRVHIDAATANRQNFPVDIQQKRLGSWRRLRDHHRDRIKRDGPAGLP